MSDRIATVPWERCKEEDVDGQCTLVVGHRGVHRPETPAAPEPILVRVYRGKQEWAAYSFQNDAAMLAQQGYTPIAQVYAPGQWSAVAYLVGVAAILLFGLGLLILAYLVIVKPDGTLTVTYRRMGYAPPLTLGS